MFRLLVGSVALCLLGTVSHCEKAVASTQRPRLGEFALGSRPTSQAALRLQEQRAQEERDQREFYIRDAITAARQRMGGIQAALEVQANEDAVPRFVRTLSASTALAIGELEASYGGAPEIREALHEGFARELIRGICCLGARDFLAGSGASPRQALTRMKVVLAECFGESRTSLVLHALLMDVAAELRREARQSSGSRGAEANEALSTALVEIVSQLLTDFSASSDLTDAHAPTQRERVFYIQSLMTLADLTMPGGDLSRMPAPFGIDDLEEVAQPVARWSVTTQHRVNCYLIMALRGVRNLVPGTWANAADMLEGSFANRPQLQAYCRTIVRFLPASVPPPFPSYQELLRQDFALDVVTLLPATAPAPSGLGGLASLRTTSGRVELGGLQGLRGLSAPSTPQVSTLAMGRILSGRGDLVDARRVLGATLQSLYSFHEQDVHGVSGISNQLFCNTIAIDRLLVEPQVPCAFSEERVLPTLEQVRTNPRVYLAYPLVSRTDASRAFARMELFDARCLTMLQSQVERGRRERVALSLPEAGARQNIATFFTAGGVGDRETPVPLWTLLGRIFDLIQVIDQGHRGQDIFRDAENGRYTAGDYFLSLLAENIETRGGCMPGIINRFVIFYARLVLMYTEAVENGLIALAARPSASAVAPVAAARAPALSTVSSSSPPAALPSASRAPAAPPTPRATPRSSDSDSRETGL